jgi:hypothetical protein
MQIIFYLFEGKEHIKLILGSSNLTGTGLFSNIESSILIEFDSENQDGVKLLGELKSYYKSLLNFSDKNLFEITDSKIEEFVLKGIVPTEFERRQIFNRKITSTSDEDKLSSISLDIPKRNVPKIPLIFKRKKSDRRKGTKVAIEAEVGIGVAEVSSNENIESLQILWDSGPLTERDLTIPKGVNTHPTASMLFKKGKTQGIDQRQYFRNVVFSALPWAFEKNPKASHLERATAFFQIIIMGVNNGIFSLLLTHNTKTDTRSYEQKNSMTSLSWGEARNLIAKDELIGKSAILYKSENQSNKFVLVIN